MSESLVPYNNDDGEVSLQRGDLSVRQQFRDWERKGRGWDLHEFPVDLEPPFRPFCIFEPPRPPVSDDGRVHTFLSRLFDKSGEDHRRGPCTALEEGGEAAHLQRYREYLAQADEPAFCSYYSHDFAEIGMVCPRDFGASTQSSERFLHSLAHATFPIAFEVVGNAVEVRVQFAATEPDLRQLRQQLVAHFPDCNLDERGDSVGYDGHLAQEWLNGGESPVVVDFGLSEEYLLPLDQTHGPETDPLVAIVGALSDLNPDEMGVFQVILQRASGDWPKEIAETLYAFDGTGFFDHIPNFKGMIARKLESSLYAVVLRVGARSRHRSRSMQIVRDVASGLAQFGSPPGNEFIPLSNDGFEPERQEQALLDRQSFRCGMLLNTGELASLVHPPSDRVRSEKLLRDERKTKAPPTIATGNTHRLGVNEHRGASTEVSLSTDQRTRHMHILGSTGSGKSTLLLNLIRQDLDSGHGLCVLDPHGDLIDNVMASVPEGRVDDVVLFDPSDAAHPIGFNFLQARSQLERTVLSSDLVAAFRRMSTTWGDVMDAVLANAILALLERPAGGTLLDLKRFLVERSFRDEFLDAVADEGVRYFWRHEFPLIAGKPQASILIRLDTFLRQGLIRNIVCQKETTLHFRRIMDEGKVLLVKLSQGLIGEENCHLLGTLIVSKLYQTALTRQDTTHRPHFWLYLDEFQHFITPSMENVLSGSRKYNLGLVLAHQEFRQLQARSQEVASSVMSNCYTRICFRLGDADAEKMSGGFSFFDAKALQNLGVGQAIARVERSDYDFNLAVRAGQLEDPKSSESRKNRILENTRKKFARNKSSVEVDIRLSFKSGRSAAMGATAKGQDADEGTKKSKEKPGKGASSDGSAGEATNVHRYVQNIIKRIGEHYGFIATLEKPVFGGVGRVDVALERDGIRIACEVAHTNATEYEVRNLQKCLTSGFDRVAVISTDRRHLKSIEQRAELVLSPVHLPKVHFIEPENFHLLLESLPAIKPTLGADLNKVKGYKVKISVKEPPRAEASTKRSLVRDLVSRVVRRMKRYEDE